MNSEKNLSPVLVCHLSSSQETIDLNFLYLLSEFLFLHIQENTKIESYFPLLGAKGSILIFKNVVFLEDSDSSRICIFFSFVSDLFLKNYIL